MAQQRRGREPALDMIRTLAVVFALVVPLWFFGQASPDDEKSIRPVDPRPTYQAFSETTGGPTPSTPEGWTPNVQALESEVARVGFVREDSYMEWQGSTGTEWLADATGKGQQVGTVDVGGTTWQRWEDGDEHVSLVRTVGKVTVLVGGVRETATLEELQSLAATVR